MENVFKTMHSGFSIPASEDFPDKPRKTQLAKHFGAVVSGNKSANLNILNQDMGNFELEMELLDSTLIYKTKFQPYNDIFAIPLNRQEPTLTMMFQELGITSFNIGENPLVMSPGQHSFNYFPDFDCNMNFPQDDLSLSLIIKLKPDYLKNYAIENDHLGGWLYEQMEKNSSPVSSLNELPITPEIRVILHQMRTCKYSEGFRKLYIDGLVRILLTLQLDAYNTQVMQKKPVLQDQKINRLDIGKLHEVREYLDQHYLDNHSLFSLSRRFGLNEFKLKYGFKKIFGTPVMQYILALRLNHAINLLRETEIPVNEIARIIGYEHANNFSAGFKKWFGKTPQHFRNQRFPRT